MGKNYTCVFISLAFGARNMWKTASHRPSVQWPAQRPVKRDIIVTSFVLSRIMYDLWFFFHYLTLLWRVVQPFLSCQFFCQRYLWLEAIFLGETMIREAKYLDTKNSSGRCTFSFLLRLIAGRKNYGNPLVRIKCKSTSDKTKTLWVFAV